jgi:putative spermidine/putrescine transport system substrate-binding protein
MSRPRPHGAVAAATALTLVLAACGSSTTSSAGGASATRQPPPKVAMASSLGPGEGAVNVVAWAGYAEDGTNDPKVDWVHPFEKATGCKVNVKVANTSDEMVTLMHTGQYDVVSASGDATLRLIYSGDVAPWCLATRASSPSSRTATGTRSR